MFVYYNDLKFNSFSFIINSLQTLPTRVDTIILARLV